MKSPAFVILAAGLGKRMGSDLPKVMVSTSDKPLIHHVLAAISPLNPNRTVVVTGHKRELVEGSIRAEGAKHGYNPAAVTFSLQAEQRGTGHAVRCALPALDGFEGTVVILCGDMPLVRSETIGLLLESHRSRGATVSLMSFSSESPGYGRIIRNAAGEVTAIREYRDCTPAEQQIREVNASLYAVESSFLTPALAGLRDTNAQGEFYLTDIVGYAVDQHLPVNAVLIADGDELHGVNTRTELARVNTILNQRRVRDLIEGGVTVSDPASLFIDEGVSVGAGVVIGPNVQLRGTTTVGAGTIIEGTALLTSCTIGAAARIKLGVVAEESVIGASAAVGPFAHLRTGTVLGEEVKIGNFVETKKAVLAAGAKASHLTYLGDCTVGEDTNIGAGTITCNYDGFRKSQTTIGRAVFIGSDTCLVAPVTVEDGAVIGAGSVITKRVEADALAFSRPPQVNKAGWSKRRRDLNSK